MCLGTQVISFPALTTCNCTFRLQTGHLALTERRADVCQIHDKKAESVVGRGVVNRPCRQAPVNPQTPRTEKGTEGRPAGDMCEHLYPRDPRTSAPSRRQSPPGSGRGGRSTHRTRVTPTRRASQFRRHSFRFLALPRPLGAFSLLPRPSSVKGWGLAGKTEIRHFYWPASVLTSTRGARAASQAGFGP